MRVAQFGIVNMEFPHISILAAIGAALLSICAPATAAEPTPTGDIPAEFRTATDQDDYLKRDVMIAMRDGAKLHTVIIIPKGATHAPIILDRTPYSASKFTSRTDSPHRAILLGGSYGVSNL
jgi:predicted acyl esterase